MHQVTNSISATPDYLHGVEKGQPVLVPRSSMAVSGDGIQIVDNLETGGTTSALSAEQGKILGPTIILDRASTSWAKCTSVSDTDYKHSVLADLLATKKNIIVDTPIYINDTVSCSVVGQKIEFAPGGRIYAGAGMSQKAMLSISGDSTRVTGASMDNPMMLKSATGARQIGIEIVADHVTVEGSYFWRMLHAVACRSTGDWYGTQIIGNRAYACLGVGPGSTDDGSTNFGEDRGDAFNISGATGMMLGNYAYCGAGQDARIAFHCEGLAAFRTRAANPEWDEKDFIIANNWAYGTFRRHFVLESVARSVMKGNISAGGATWWALALIQTSQTVVSDMILRYTRGASETAGAAWNPQRAAIAFINYSSSTKVSGVDVEFSPGAVGKGLHSQKSGGEHVGTELSNIVIRQESTLRGRGIDTQGLEAPVVRSCRVSGAGDAIYSYGAERGFYENNILDNNTQGYNFTTGSATLSAPIIRGGLVSNGGVGISVSTALSLDIQGVTFSGLSSYDINAFTVAELIVKNCTNKQGTGVLRYGGSLTGTWTDSVRDVENNPGFTYGWRHNVTSISSITSLLNTRGKFSGKSVMATDGVLYVASGSTAAAPWAKTAAATTPV